MRYNGELLVKKCDGMNNSAVDHYYSLKIEFGFSDRQISDFEQYDEDDMRVLDIQDALSVVDIAYRDLVGLWISTYRTQIGRDVGKQLKQDVIDIKWFKRNKDAINIKLAYYAHTRRIRVIPASFMNA